MNTCSHCCSATPNGNSVSALNLLLLDGLTLQREEGTTSARSSDKGYTDRALEIFKATGDIIVKAHQAFYYLLIALDFFTDANPQIALVSPSSAQDGDVEPFLDVLRKLFTPNAVKALIVEGRQREEEEEKEKEEFEVGLLRGKTALNGKVTAYLCEGKSKTCRAPTHRPQELEQELNAMKNSYTV